MVKAIAHGPSYCTPENKAENDPLHCVRLIYTAPAGKGYSGYLCNFEKAFDILSVRKYFPHLSASSESAIYAGTLF